MNNNGEIINKHPAYIYTNYTEVYVHHTQHGPGFQCVLGEAVGLGRTPTPTPIPLHSQPVPVYIIVVMVIRRVKRQTQCNFTSNLTVSKLLLIVLSISKPLSHHFPRSKLMHILFLLVLTSRITIDSHNIEDRYAHEIQWCFVWFNSLSYIHNCTNIIQ